MSKMQCNFAFAKQKRRLLQENSNNRRLNLVQRMATEFSQNNIHGEVQTPEILSAGEAIIRLTEIVRKNENCMAQAFANAPEWQSRAQMTMTTFRDDVDDKNQRKLHTVVNVPSSFSKEQKEALKEYAIEMGGIYTSIKVVEQGPDGKENISFQARIEFGKDTAYTPEVCAKMLLGEEKDSLIKEILESNATHKQKQLIEQDKEKKMSNSNDQSISDKKRSGLKL